MLERQALICMLIHSPKTRSVYCYSIHDMSIKESRAPVAGIDHHCRAHPLEPIMVVAMTFPASAEPTWNKQGFGALMSWFKPGSFPGPGLLETRDVC